MSKPSKTVGANSRPQARLPKGFQDTPAEHIRATTRMLATIREVYERYGFEPLETPAIEYTDALGKFLPDQDRPNEGVFSFQDVAPEARTETGMPEARTEAAMPEARTEAAMPEARTEAVVPEARTEGHAEQWLSLRYDLTAPLARYVAENFERLPKPFRRYQVGPVWRNEKPGPGRFRQFTQFDADTVGTDNIAADAEICMLAADTLEALGIPRGQYVIKVSNRKLLDGALEAIGLGDDENAGKRLTVLRAIDKLDRLGADGVRQLLGKGRKDESGDFTKGAGLSEVDIEAILAFTMAEAFYPEGPFIEDDFASEEFPGLRLSNIRTVWNFETIGFDNDTFASGAAELGTISKLLTESGYGTRRVQVTPSVVRGLEYYTGPVFEAELTFQVTNEDGQPVRFGSVGGGGRYDGLVERFLGTKVPATGFSIGVSRLQAALAALDKDKPAASDGPVVVLVMEKDRLAEYQAMTQALRNAGIRAEMYLGTSGMKAQMKYADRRGAPCVVIQGGDERAKGEVQIKDLIEGAKAAATIKDSKEWRESRPAQFSVSQGDLVAKVREVLARHRG